MRAFVSVLAGKRLLLPVFLLFLVGMAFGIDKNDIKVTPPTFKSTNPGVNADDINKAAKDDFNTLRNTIYDSLKFLPDDFTNIARGFANASVYSSDGASQRGYEGYNKFSITVGPVFALQLPQFDVLKDMLYTINNDGELDEVLEVIMDTSFGFDPKISAQFGMNTSFLLKGLYLGVRFSKFDTGWFKQMPLLGFSFNIMSIGVNAKYQLISQKRLLAGLLVWRGLNLGSGFIWQNTSLYWRPDLPEELMNVPIQGINMPVNGDIRLDFETNTYIIPIEAMTSIRLVGVLNLAMGAGVDIAIGSSRIGVSASFNVDKNKVNNDLQSKGLIMETEPSLVLNPIGGGSGPSLLNVKAMSAVGFNFGPIIIDIPVTYYFLGNGFSFGLTLGVTL